MFKFTTFGCDPEFFIEKEGDIVPFFGTTLDKTISHLSYLSKPYRVKLHADNCMGEISVSPYSIKEYGYRNLGGFVEAIRDKVNTIAMAEGYATRFYCSHEFDDEQLKNKKAHEIGCQPFLVVGKGLIKPEPYKDNLRHAGGHIHLGWEYSGSGEVSPELIVKVLDKVLLPNDRSCPKRAEIYGMPGAYRMKPYGIEYRSLSNLWMTSPDYLVDGLKKAETVINKILEKTGGK